MSSSQPTTTSPKPLRADARRNRELVLCAARECIGVAGVQAQMDEIAQRAGVGVGTVYRHFETKDALIEALADEYFAAVAAEARAALELEDPWDAFSSYIHRASKLLAANRGLAQVAAEQPEVMKAAAERAAAELGFFDTMEEILRRAHNAGVLRSDFTLADIPAIMCSIGALQVSQGAYANWPRMLDLMLSGVHRTG